MITTNKPTTSLFLQAGFPSCRPTNSVKSLKGKYHIPWTCLPLAHLGVFQLLSLSASKQRKLLTDKILILFRQQHKGNDKNNGILINPQCIKNSLKFKQTSWTLESLTL